MSETSLYNVHIIERVLRLFTGISLISAVFFIPIPFDYLIVLPLMGIYPCLTGINGWDPIYHLADINLTEITFEFETELSQNITLSYLAPKFA